MSDLLIRGMDMPKSCALCRIKRRNGKKMACPLLDEEWDIHDPMSADHRLDNCPLGPVPPHGRLIDADALLSKDRQIYRIDGAAIGARKYIEFSEIKDAPTIIPAEEASDG